VAEKPSGLSSGGFEFVGGSPLPEAMGVCAPSGSQQPGQNVYPVTVQRMAANKRHSKEARVAIFRAGGQPCRFVRLVLSIHNTRYDQRLNSVLRAL
jgi:hypothetical protein